MTSRDRVENTTVEERLLELDRLALEDDVRPNESSRRDLLSFVARYQARRPSVSLLDNGDFRAVWRNGHKEQLGLRFLGEGRATYVAFYLVSGRIKREYGKCSVPEIDLLIRDERVDLLPLLYRSDGDQKAALLDDTGLRGPNKA